MTWPKRPTAPIRAGCKCLLSASLAFGRHRDGCRLPRHEEVGGAGTDACPKGAVCLYQDSNYNNDSHEGRGDWIRVVTGTTTRIRDGGNDEASSVYANLNARSTPTRPSQVS
ncbi:peptidase inhibitor family I36 protein [Streptomyces sp. NPDC001933]|uniref:peptidase inhibitor family I36 protein n=1 Tax=Streptomyces sp. NPDC001933 TaxID=3364626 RepID=UPI0036A514F3